MGSPGGSTTLLDPSALIGVDRKNCVVLALSCDVLDASASITRSHSSSHVPVGGCSSHCCCGKASDGRRMGMRPASSKASRRKVLTISLT